MSTDTTPERTYTVTGMTCAHCVMSVTEEVSEVEGVIAVDVDLATGHVRVSGDGFTDEAVRAADYVVTMGCGDSCPVYPGRRYLDWDIEDPVGKPIATVRRIRDDIDQRVRSLLPEILAASGGGHPASS